MGSIGRSLATAWFAVVFTTIIVHAAAWILHYRCDGIDGANNQEVALERLQMAMSLAVMSRCAGHPAIFPALLRSAS